MRIRNDLALVSVDTSSLCIIWRKYFKKEDLNSHDAVQLKSVAFFDLWYNGEDDKRKYNKKGKVKSEHFCNALTIALGQNKRWAKFEWTVKCRYPLPAMIKNSQLPNSTDWPCVRVKPLEFCVIPPWRNCINLHLP